PSLRPCSSSLRQDCSPFLCPTATSVSANRRTQLRTIRPCQNANHHVALLLAASLLSVAFHQFIKSFGYFRVSIIPATLHTNYHISTFVEYNGSGYCTT